MMGDRFCRMWDFYLASAELGFLNGSNFVFQILISARRDDVPVIRDYIALEERRLLGSGDVTYSPEAASWAEHNYRGPSSRNGAQAA